MTHQDLESNVATVDPADIGPRRAGRRSIVVNWLLALLTVPVAVPLCALALLLLDGVVLAVSF